jgi:vacuolar-type H+-ATPase subunit E/Vma4|eukprot:COSAG01_NODE_4726_length_4789_cov_12.625160_8_plen_45_part_00
MLWQRAEQEIDRIKEEAKRREERELGPLLNRLREEERYADCAAS